MFPSCFFCFVLRLILLHVYSQVQKLSLKPAKLYDLTDGTLRGLHKMLNLWFFLLILTMIPLNSKALTEEKKQLRYFGLPPSDPFCTCQQCSVTPQRNVTACAGQLCTHWWHLARFYQISPFSHISAWKGNKQCLPRHLVLLPTHASRRLSSREQLWSLICPTHLKPCCQGTCLVPASFQEESCWGLGDASQHTAMVEKTPLCQMQQFPESDQRPALVSSEFLKWVVLLSSFA